MTTSSQSTLALTPTFTTKYAGKLFEIVTWEGKPGITFEAARRAPGVRLLIETTKAGMKALVMTKEIRREAGGVDYRLPGGKVFDTLAQLHAHYASAEDMQKQATQAAKREAAQEAGIHGGEYTLLAISKNGASVEWDLYYFLVTNAQVGTQALEAEEEGDIEPVTVSAEEIYEKLSAGEIKEGRSADMLWAWLVRNGYLRFQK